MAKKQSTDLSTILGLGMGVGSLLAAMILEFKELNPELGSDFLKVSALLIIFGGSAGATLLNVSGSDFKTIPALIKVILRESHFNPQEFVDQMVKYAESARREGILSLEKQVKTLGDEDDFLAHGMRLVIDGASPEMTEAMLEGEVEVMEARHRVGSEVFTSLGGYCPTMGIIGTVVGLIAALAKAGEGEGGAEGAKAVVAAIATAFIATFYGIGAANLIFLPIAGKLKTKSTEEAAIRRLKIDAIKAIQAGESPRMVSLKLVKMFRKGEVTESERKG